MTVQQPTSGIARLTVVLAGSRRRKAAVMVGLVMIGAAMFNPVGVDDTSVVLSPDESGTDEFLQIEMMLAELEQEAVGVPAATSQPPPGHVSNASTTTSLIIPGSVDDSPLTTKSESPVAVSPTPPSIAPTHSVSYQDSRSDSPTRAARPHQARTEPDSRSRARPPAIHLTGTIDPL